MIGTDIIIALLQFIYHLYRPWNSITKLLSLVPLGIAFPHFRSVMACVGFQGLKSSVSSLAIDRNNHIYEPSTRCDMIINMRLTFKG
jgi:hypothetical protein